MKRILNLPTLLLVAMSAMFLYSCSDDPVDPPVTNDPPSITLTSESDLTVAPQEVFTVNFTASKGSDSPLNGVTVYEDGTAVPNSRLKVNGSDVPANPISVSGTDVDGLSWSIDIVAQSSAGTTVTFEVEVVDLAQEKGSVLVNVTTAGVPPSLTTTSPTTVTVDQDIKNLFRLTAAMGTGDLASIEIRENDQLVDPSRIFWQMIGMAVSENPFALGENEVGGFDDQELYIMTPAVEGNFIYKVLLTDAFGLTAQLEFDVTTLPSGTAIEMRAGVLLNSAGPAGTGGLDLDTGMSTGTGMSDTDGEIKDNGIDNTLPDADNWRRTISPFNGASMKYLRAGEGGLPETFLFEDVAFKEDLPGFFDSGVELMDGATEVVQPGDVFIVERDGTYWMLEVIEVSTDPNDNSDSYTFDIKY